MLVSSTPRMANIRLICVIILFSCLVTPVLGQSCEQQIVVNVRDAKGNFVSNLQASSFRAKVGGREAVVTSANVFAGSNRLILVLDASGSMSGYDMRRWKAIEGLTEEIVASAPAWSKLALLVFNAQTVRKVEFGHSRKELIAAIEQLPPAKGQTALWNALLEADGMFGEPARGDAMVVFSDFGDNFSKLRNQGSRRPSSARESECLALAFTIIILPRRKSVGARKSFARLRRKPEAPN